MPKTRTPQLTFLFFSTFILLIMLGSCTVYYKTSDIKKTFSQSQKEINKALVKIAKDRREKRGIYNQLSSNIPDSTMSPYPALSTELGAMTRSLTKLKQTAKQLEHLKAKFSRLVKGKKKIESKSSSWDNFQTIKKEYEVQSDKFESLSKAYNISSNKFVDLLNKHHISKIKVVELRKQMDKYIVELNQSVQSLADEIANSRQDSRTDKMVLNQLEEILATVRADQQTLESLIGQFEKEVGDEPTIWSGPGMHSFSILADMKNIGDQISKKGQKINKIAGNL
ncbi:MAG: hypothetical protein HOD43_02800 [Candidatus Marinimicrobia bacterium]|jgi:chromosome segregation ATPase|nr:hypothetical protein [Candidatus Neomarinimicrobiota bacterium]MBT3574469.1 hypothetical protein [Candidatus Neomarinimicrobiota bacterium]MBT3824205.1 hypothetical protein [Candidatus Neomarinimicrobiota bacterium]MBT4129697.1 hypothetical protein [Candidatus Neomarinimicrobiota bacterium]MBT4294714.1 hypothetical protein [Candidatus Neomarinimicrobiota bacterium]